MRLGNRGVTEVRTEMRDKWEKGQDLIKRSNPMRGFKKGDGFNANSKPWGKPQVRQRGGDQSGENKTVFAKRHESVMSGWRTPWRSLTQRERTCEREHTLSTRERKKSEKCLRKLRGGEQTADQGAQLVRSGEKKKGGDPEVLIFSFKLELWGPSLGKGGSPLEVHPTSYTTRRSDLKGGGTSSSWGKE